MARGLEDVTQSQRDMWGRGDFHRIGVSQVLVGELLVQALAVGAGERVLDVAAGAGNAALAAARRWADVTCTDYVPQLLQRARVRADAEGLPMSFAVADAQRLPFADASFDVVVSTFGAMFAPDQAVTAAELLRVLRPGGRLGMANWTPHSWVGEQFALQARYLPTPDGVRPPTVWGTPEGLADLLGPGVEGLDSTVAHFEFVHLDAARLWDQFSAWFGPVATALERLDPVQRKAFQQDWLSTTERHDVAPDGGCRIPSSYLQVLAVKRAGERRAPGTAR